MNGRTRMETKFPASEPVFRIMSPETTRPSVPAKRKSMQDDTDSVRSASAAPTGPDEARSSADPQLSPNEYETGRVTCEGCGKSVSFRDEATNKFTVKHWDLHRQECPSQPIIVSDAVMYTPESHGEPSVQPIKRRRAKRTEQERIDYLRSDPYVAQFEAYRVLCASCDKWIRLRPNSTYCSIPWDAHRKSCLTKKAAKAPDTGDERSKFLSTDPQVREFDEQRARCKICETWVQIGDGAGAVQTWVDHRTLCLQSRSTISTSASAPQASSSKANNVLMDSVPPPSKHLMALVSSSSFPAAPPPTTSPSRPFPSRKTSAHASSPTSPLFTTSFKDLNPSNFPPSQESRRRNAEQRAATLRADPLISEVQPNRVFCSMCKKWVQLRQDSSYCAYPWVQHREKCQKRQQRRAQKEADLAEYRAQMEALRREEQARPADDTDELESEEGAESGDDDLRARRRAERREARRRAKQQAEADRQRRMAERRALLKQKEAAIMNTSDGDEDAEGESDMEYEMSMVQLADLDSAHGRLEFVSRSVHYLFKTTYEYVDDLTIAALVTYLNAAIPPDKHEDFDTTEVTKAAMMLHERGEVRFEGDILRLPR